MVFIVLQVVAASLLIHREAKLFSETFRSCLRPSSVPRRTSIAFFTNVTSRPSLRRLFVVNGTGLSSIIHFISSIKPIIVVFVAGVVCVALPPSCLFFCGWGVEELDGVETFLPNLFLVHVVRETSAKEKKRPAKHVLPRKVTNPSHSRGNFPLHRMDR